MSQQQPGRRTALKAAGAGALAVAAGAAAADTATAQNSTTATRGERALAAQLRRALPDERVLVRGDAAYDAERAAYHRVIDHHPAAIVVPRHADDIATAVRIASHHRVPIAVQATGHGISRSAHGGLLINTRRLNRIRIDPSQRTAVVSPGVVFSDLIDAAAAHGLAPASGSAVDVSVTGYTSGGGLPVIGRTVGYAADHITRVDLVDAKGRRRRLTPHRDADLFWAVRGGKSNFGVITEIETALFPLTRLYGGNMLFIGGVPELLRAYQKFTRNLTERMTTSLVIVNVPTDSPAFPAPLRGKTLAKLRVAFTGDAAEGEKLLRPLRALGPAQDSVADMPYTDIAKIYADPAGPIRTRERAGALRALDDATLRRLLRAAGPDADRPPMVVEIRHLGGALARAPKHPNAVGPRDAAFNLFVADVAPDPGQDAALEAGQQRLFDILGPSLTGHTQPNFLTDHDTTATRVRRAYRPRDYERLTTLKRRYDRHNLFRVNHNIPPAA
ncbi:FAD-binding oxidoreductase [Streptomyces sp. AN091965]|uniref:FAD-binding oxidoreductase n=1 Tax=Streptomyces sp. AN091965 TaxID=2927803 RepID=UPI001F6102A1|nr:FAD-binding oxidoreductase [Streptomyces sp. AN091965]MCI3927702.1 FAD-binding oxidoreductase [Streptomyces sp. AN091965]MCI3927725.1 FAD-binding oxidoreductase [Streptomyces sp. AN091965]